jgi:hypothetical protein
MIDKDNKNLQRIELADKPIITATDIEVYYWNEHRIVLTKNGLKKLPDSKEVGGYGKPFVVVVDGARCYRGAFWTSFSSVSHPNPVINAAPLHPRKHSIVIEKAYPSDSFAKGQDPRNDERIYNALRKLGKLNNKK